MSEKKISITLWGNMSLKENWIKYYDDVKEIIYLLGYQITHLGLSSDN